MTQPKMTRHQAIALWNSLTATQKAQFNDMLKKMEKGELMLEHINVDDNEVVQNISLTPKDKKSTPIEPFMKHFHLDANKS